MNWPPGNTYRQVRVWLLELLTSVEDERERENITSAMLSFRSDKSRASMIADNHRFSESDLNFFVASAERLNQHVPLQYITQEAWFYDRPFFVDQRVLIPRPETEELVEQALCAFPAREKIRALDIGTGSGVIPITLKLEHPSWHVSAWDVSVDALDVAQRNAKALQADISLVEVDVLGDELPDGNYDLIVSNPPYIPEQDKGEMQSRVLEHEPHLALFVEDHEPLIFYHKIAQFASNRLTNRGILLFEIHENMGEELIQNLSSQFKIEMMSDAQGKARILSCRPSN